MMFAPKMTREQWAQYERQRERLVTWRHRVTAALGFLGLAYLLMVQFPW